MAWKVVGDDFQTHSLRIISILRSRPAHNVYEFDERRGQG